MAAVAGGVRGSERVVAVDVAGRAGSLGGIGMSSGQRPAGRAVIKLSVCPIHRVMAGGALCRREPRSDVIGNGPAKRLRLGPVRLVATVAIGVGRSQRVVASHVTLRAGRDLASRRHLVRARQRPTGTAVIELAVSPGSDGVATGTSGGGGREVRSVVIRNVAAERLRLVPIGCVAGEAVRGIQSVIIVDVAGSAGRRRGRHVRADKSEAGDAVIERSRAPSHGGVALGAVGGRKSGAGGGVHGSGGLLPLGEMAAGVAAIGRLDLQVVIVVDVAGSAGNVGVPVCQKKAGGAVIEFAVGPFGDGVAGGAGSRGRREAGGDVIGDVATEGLCFVPVRGVAGRGVGGRKG